MNLHDIIFKNWGSETIKAPATRTHYFANEPWRTTLGYAAPKQRKPKSAPMQSKMFDVLKMNPGATSEKIAEIMGKTVASATRTLYLLSCKGVVTHKLGPRPEHGGRQKFLYYAQEAAE